MKNILLATDGSSSAEEAAAFLAHLPHAEKLELTVLTVIDSPFVNDSFLSGDWAIQSAERDRAAAAEAYEKIEGMFAGADVQLRHLVREGSRGETIVEVAKTIQADLVVLGARGHSPVARLLLGSTSDYVATHAHCSVLAVRPGLAKPTKHPLRIAIGYDGSRSARAALEEIDEVAWGREPEFHAVSVVSYLAGLFEEREVELVRLREAATKAASEAAEQLRESAVNAAAHMIENPHTGEGLVQFAEAQECDLVVVGETPRTTLTRFLLGSTCRFVLRHAPCSVWIARTRALHLLDKNEDYAQLSAS